MEFPKHQSLGSALRGMALALALSAFAPAAHANVYATNIKVNGALLSAVTTPGRSVNISYILNEPASAGVTIKVLSGATAVRTIAIAGGSAGTTRGLNTVVWDGKNDSNVNVPGGNYSVSIAAASTGYSGWTLTTVDTNGGNNVWEPRGIAVDRNANSPYYGRVFAANAVAHAGSYLGYQVGILKCNADGSYADEGGLSTGGYAWAGDGFSPWKLQVSDDDYVYVNDWTGNGEIYRFDPTISSASQLHVLRSNNRGSGYDLSGLAIFGTGTNTEIWMADDRYSGGVVSVGLVKYQVTADGTCATGDTGSIMVGTGGDLSLYPGDVALDKYKNIYTVQSRWYAGDPAPRVLRFAADPSTNSNVTFPEYTADWAVGSGGALDWSSACGLAVDPTGTYLAVGFQGQFGDGGGNTKILSTTDGSVITSLDLGVSLGGLTAKADYDVDWDAVGNVYLVDEWYGCWRAYSPPGANSATTTAVVVISVIPPPVITSQPLSRTNEVATTASFTVMAAGVTPLHYQWCRDGTNLMGGGSLSGVTTTNLVIDNVQFADAGDYTVVVTNTYGSVTSQVARLTVEVVPPETLQAQAMSAGWLRLVIQGNAGRVVTLQGSPDLFHWARLNTHTNQTGTLVLTNSQPAGRNAYFYRTAVFPSDPPPGVPAPTLSGAQWLTQGRMRFDLNAVAGSAWRVEGTPDLVHWGDYGVLTNASGVLAITNTPWRQVPAYFYRVAQP
jgi:hypothetical protein